MELTQRLLPVLRCTVCGAGNNVEPEADSTSLALFGLAEIEQLFLKGICPKCLRKHQNWTAEEQNTLARWIIQRLEQGARR